MRRWMLLGVIVAGGLAACGGDPCDADGSFFGGAGALVPVRPTMSAAVWVDADNTVIVELIATTGGGACATGTTQTTRLVWNSAQRRLIATTAVPSTRARRLTGAMLGGGVTTWENVPPNLTIRALTDPSGNLVINVVEAGMMPVSTTCAASFAPVCM